MDRKQPPEQGFSLLFSLQRREWLLDQLRASGALTVHAGALSLGVSEATIRRDVNLLAREGLAKRVHGGATLPDPVDPPDGCGHPSSGHSTYGMVVPSMDYYWPQVISGAREAADEANIGLVVRSSAYSAADTRHQVHTLLQSYDIAALIVAPETANRDGRGLLAWLTTLSIPVILVERRPPAEIPAHRFDWAVTDHAFGAGMAVRHLWQEGHRRIGCLTDALSPTSPQVVRGWRHALACLHIASEWSVQNGSYQHASTDRARHFDRVLQDCRTTKTTALLIHSDAQAVAFVQHCISRGIDVPADMAVVAYDDELAGSAVPAISAVRPPKPYLGRVAVQLASARLNEGESRPLQKVTLIPDLVLRRSSLNHIVSAARP